MIYFDNAATSLKKPDCVIEAVISAMKSAGNASRGACHESLSSDRIIYNVRKKIANLFSAENPRQVVFTKNSTEALNLALNGLLNSKDHVITSCMEHNSVLRPLNYLKKEKSVDVDYIDIDSNGELNYEIIPKLIRKNTRLLVLNHASNVTGNINDLKKIGKLCKDKNIIFVVDASQTAGAFDINMKDDFIDVLCFTGHKSLLGPQGTGGLCVKKDIYIRPLISGGTGIHTYDIYQPDQMPSRLEAGTLNAHSIAGLGAGIDYILENGMENLTKTSSEIAKYFYNEISNIDGIKFYGNYQKNYKAPIVSLNIKDMDSSKVSFILSEKYNISTRPGAHCAPLLHKSFGTENQGMVRFSFSHSNSFQEVDAAVKAIKEIIYEN